MLDVDAGRVHRRIHCRRDFLFCTVANVGLRLGGNWLVGGRSGGELIEDEANAVHGVPRERGRGCNRRGGGVANRAITERK